MIGTTPQKPAKLIISGVCCFPYGELLDQTFDIIEKAKKRMDSKRDASLPDIYENLFEKDKSSKNNGL